jgi:hypothetical protein
MRVKKKSVYVFMWMEKKCDNSKIEYAQQPFMYLKFHERTKWNLNLYPPWQIINENFQCIFIKLFFIQIMPYWYSSLNITWSFLQLVEILL